MMMSRNLFSLKLSRVTFTLHFYCLFFLEFNFTVKSTLTEHQHTILLCFAILMLQVYDNKWSVLVVKFNIFPNRALDVEWWKKTTSYLVLNHFKAFIVILENNGDCLDVNMSFFRSFYSWYSKLTNYKILTKQNKNTKIKRKQFIILLFVLLFIF